MGSRTVLAAAACAALATAAVAGPPSPRPSPTLPPGAAAMTGGFHPGAALHRAVEAWNAGNLDDLEAALAPDVVLVTGVRTVRGRDEVLDALAAPLDLKLHAEVTRVVAGARGDAAWAACRFTAGQGLDEPRSGAAVVVFHRIEGDWRAVLVHLTNDEAQP